MVKNNSTNNCIFILINNYAPKINNTNWQCCGLKIIFKDDKINPSNDSKKKREYF